MLRPPARPRPRPGPRGKTPYDPNRLPKFILRHAINGIVAGWVAMLALIWLDLGGLGARLAASPDGDLATALLAIGFGVTFGFVGIGYGVLIVLPGLEPPRDAPED